MNKPIVIPSEYMFSKELLQHIQQVKDSTHQEAHCILRDCLVFHHDHIELKPIKDGSMIRHVLEALRFFRKKDLPISIKGTIDEGRTSNNVTINVIL